MLFKEIKADESKHYLTSCKAFVEHHCWKIFVSDGLSNSLFSMSKLM